MIWGCQFRRLFDPRQLQIGTVVVPGDCTLSVEETQQCLRSVLQVFGAHVGWDLCVGILNLGYPADDDLPTTSKDGGGREQEGARGKPAESVGGRVGSFGRKGAVLDTEREIWCW